MKELVHIVILERFPAPPWGSQSWLPPAFQPARETRRSVGTLAKNALVFTGAAFYFLRVPSQPDPVHRVIRQVIQ